MPHTQLSWLMSRLTRIYGRDTYSIGWPVNQLMINCGAPPSNQTEDSPASHVELPEGRRSPSAVRYLKHTEDEECLSHSSCKACLIKLALTKCLSYHDWSVTFKTQDITRNVLPWIPQRQMLSVPCCRRHRLRLGCCGGGLLTWPVQHGT